MTKIAVVGTGKLGFPIALSMATKHDVVGYDVSPAAKEILASKKYPHREVKAQEYLDQTTMRMVDTIDEAVAHADIVFVIVQTPHRPEFEGVTRLTDDRADFDYTFLKGAVADVARAAEAQKKSIILSVMSTVLPGTVDREIRPLLNQWTMLVYNPAFPAMGSAIDDYENPEFVLLGVDTQTAADKVRAFYGTITTAPVVEMSIASAEATKVFYNSFITAKIGLANAWMEICHRLGANVDDVTKALSLATSRVISTKYLKGGLGDAGGCHPRDGIALSWLSRKLEMTYDLFGDLMRIREAQTDWLARLCIEEAKRTGLPIVILGKAYKKGTGLTVGSCATLLKNVINEYAWVKAGHAVDQWDPHVDGERAFTSPALFVIATDHDEFYSMSLPADSVVIDPWGKWTKTGAVMSILVGRNS